MDKWVVFSFSTKVLYTPIETKEKADDLATKLSRVVNREHVVFTADDFKAGNHQVLLTYRLGG